jgi:hypothetical protein
VRLRRTLSANYHSAMSKITQFIFLGIVISLVEGFCITSWAMAYSLSLKSPLIGAMPFLPSMIIVGIGIGVIAYYQRSGVWAVILGAGYGYAVGTLMIGLFLDYATRSTNSSGLIIHDVNWNWIDLIVIRCGQIILGIITGIIPSTLSWLYRSSR